MQFSHVNVTRGLSIFRSVSLTTKAELKASEGAVFFADLHNLTAAKAYVKFYDSPASGVTVGTTTPVMTVVLEANSGKQMPIEWGLSFRSGITVAATTGVLDSDTTAPAANGVVVNIGYA